MPGRHRGSWLPSWTILLLGGAAWTDGLGRLLGGKHLCERLDGKRDALSTADAQSNDAALQPVAPHRVNEPGRENGAGRADRMAVRDGAALDIDDLLRQAEFACHHDGDGRERLVYLEALHLIERPSRALERSLDGRDGPE